MLTDHYSNIHLHLTGEDEDEEGADPSDDPDDLTHVRNKHGDEESDGDPDHCKNHSALFLKGMCDHTVTPALNTLHQVQDH